MPHNGEAVVPAVKLSMSYRVPARQAQSAWSSPRVELDLPAVAKPYRLSFTILSFTTESTENTEFISVLSMFFVVIMLQLNL
jgi:hypothetical protein